MLSAEQSKGLEFDAVVVIEPGDIAAESASGLRLLYVALTRSTRFLTVVHSGPVLPTRADAGASEAPEFEGPTAGARGRAGQDAGGYERYWPDQWPARRAFRAWVPFRFRGNRQASIAG